MNITEIKIYPVDEDKLKAYVTIVLDNSFAIRDLKIISGNSGLFVAMPSKKRKDGTYKDIAHPLNQDARTEMEKKILNAYLAEIKKLREPADKDGYSASQSSGESETDPQ